MTRARPIFAVIVAAMAAGTPVSAQQPGSRVSILVPHAFEGVERRPGLLERVDGDSIWVRVDGMPLALSIAQAEPLVPSGGSYARQGRIVGSLAGAVLGGIWGYQGYEADPYDCSPGGSSMLFGDYGPSCSGGHDSTARTAETVVGAGLGLGIGFVTGWAVGAMIERWTPLEVDVGSMPDGGVSLAVR